MKRSYLRMVMAALFGGVAVSSFAATSEQTTATEHQAGEAERKAADAVFAAYAKMLEAPFAIDIVSTDDQGTQSKALAEYEGLSRIHVKTDRMEIISTPEGTWVHAGAEGWTQPPSEIAGMVRQFVPKSVAELRASTSNVKDDGPTTWEGQPAHAYSYDVDTQVMGAAVKAHNKVLINDAGQMVRSESDAEALGRKAHTVQTIRYGTIKVPAPQVPAPR